MLEQFLGFLGSGTLIVIVVGVIKFWAKRQEKELAPGFLRWIVYALALISGGIMAIFSSTINFTEPLVFTQWLAAVFGAAETIYRLVSGKLGLKKE